MLECWTVPCCTNKFRENRLPFSHRDFLKEKEKEKEKKHLTGRKVPWCTNQFRETWLSLQNFQEARLGSMAFHRRTFQTKLGQDKQ